MEYYEGASYRINIEGYDSTLILDGYTRTVRANVIDQNDNILVDHETATLYGTLVGNMIDVEGNVVYNAETKNLSVEKIQGSLINTFGDTVYDHYQNKFLGNFEGAFSGNIIIDDQIIYDYETNTFNSNFTGNILSSDGSLSYDPERNIFQGTFVGDFVDLDGNPILSSANPNKTLQANDGTIVFDPALNVFYGNFCGDIISPDGTVIFSSKDETQNFGNNEILYADGTTALDLETKTLIGNVAGNVITEAGEVIVDLQSRLFIGDVIGNVSYADGTTAIDNETKSVVGTLSGNVVSADGFVLVDSEQAMFMGNLIGNISTSAGELVLDAEVKTFTGTVHGDLIGNIYNSVGEIIFDADNSIFHSSVLGNITGMLVGSVVDENGFAILNADTNTLTVDTVTATTITGTFAGPLVGDVCDTNGETVLNIDTKEFNGVLVGNIQNSLGEVIYNAANSTFTGSFVGDFNGKVNVDELKIINASGSLQVVTESTVERNSSFSFLSYNDNTEGPNALFLSRGRGTIANPQPLQSGDKASAIIFSGVIAPPTIGGPEDPIQSPVAAIVTEIDGDAANGKFPGKMSCYVFNTDPTDNDFKEGWTVNSAGEFRATLADVTVVGETTKNPVNTSGPSKWLEMVVNGETVYMPLYT